MTDRTLPTGLIQSLQRGLRVLEYLATSGRPLAAKQVASGLGLNLSTAYHLLTTLEHEGYVRRTADRGYEPAHQLGSSPLVVEGAADDRMVRVGRSLGRAAFAVEDVATLSCVEDGQMRVVDVVEVPAADNAGRMYRGRREPLACCAAGIAVLATYDGSTVENIVHSAARRASLRSIPFSRQRALEHVDRARVEGVAVAVDEGHATIAAVVATSGESRLAVSVLVSAPRLRREKARLVNVVQHTVLALAKSAESVEM